MVDFPTTHWSLILDKNRREECLKDLAENYYAAICNTAKKIFHLSEEDARELTQRLFESLLIENILDKVNQKQGKLRYYLISVMRNKAFHFFEEGRKFTKDNIVKRINKFSELSDKERNTFLDITDSYSLQEEYLLSRIQNIFNQEWISIIREKSLMQLEQYCGKNDKAQKAFECFKENFFQNRKPGEIAEEINCEPRWVSEKIYRLKIKYAEFFENNIRETVADDGCLKEELEELMEYM